MSFKMKGNVALKKVAWIKNIDAITKKQINQHIARDIVAIHKEAVKGVQKKSSGETQVRYNPKRTVVASKPGDPPNTDLGSFVQSIQFDLDQNKMRGVVGTNDKRGPWFEFGTSNMAARPWLTPAINTIRNDLLQYTIEWPNDESLD